MTVKCKNGHRVDFILWIIVDGEKRPDLLRAIENGRLHDPMCEYCNQYCHVEADLLILRASRDPALIFSPARGNSPEETSKIGRSFLLKLREQMGADWRMDWYERDGRRGIATVERPVLPVFLQQ
jgi:hypothetical protein